MFYWHKGPIDRVMKLKQGFLKLNSYIKSDVPFALLTTNNSDSKHTGYFHGLDKTVYCYDRFLCTYLSFICLQMFSKCLAKK